MAKRSGAWQERPGSVAAASRQRGEPVEAPSGSNCLDLEVYIVKPDHHLTIRGTKKIKVPCADVFPLVEGIFGPLRIPLPRTPCILDAEYGSLWRQTWTVKKTTNAKPVLFEAPSDARRSAWPSVYLHSCQELQGPPWCGDGGIPA